MKHIFSLIMDPVNFEPLDESSVLLRKKNYSRAWIGTALVVATILVLLAHGNTPSLGSPTESNSKIVHIQDGYLVVAGSQVVGAFVDMAAAQAQLNTYAPRAPGPSRLICAVQGGVVGTNPETIGPNNANQGGGFDAGFNKWWEDENDINRMVEVCKAHSDVPLTQSSYQYVVIQGTRVVGSYQDMAAAQARLNQFPSAGPPSRLICSVKDGVVDLDPVLIGPNNANQGGGVAAGFNKWWEDENDINRMLAVCQSAVGGYLYTVVQDTVLVGTFFDIAGAQAVLNTYPERASPSRLICASQNGIVDLDPVLIGPNDANQGGGVDAGFNKWWEDENDINRMLATCSANLQNARVISSSYQYVVVADSRVVGAYLDMAAAQYQLDLFARGAPSRLICAVQNGVVNTDPVFIGPNNANQGGGVDAGFNKWWEDGNDINYMLSICQGYTGN